jgi:hypothetical protein
MTETAADERHGAVTKQRATEQRAVAVTVLVLALLGVVYFGVRRPILPIDDATLYVTGAQSLAQGRGYLMLGVPTEPGNTTYPPGYSLLLTPVLLLQPAFPENLSLLQAVSLLVFFSFLGVGAVTLRRCYQLPIADVALILLLIATTPLALAMSTAVLSDSLYGLVSLASLLMLDASGRHRGQRATSYLLGGVLLAVLAYYTRTAGIALIATLAIAAAMHARQAPWWRTVMLAAPTLLVIPWFVWSSVYGGSTVLRQYVHGTPGSGIPVDGPEALLIVVLGNFLLGSDILRVVAPALVSEDVFPGGLVPAALGFVAATVLFGFILYRACRAWRTTGALVHLYLLLYLFTTLLIPWRVLGRYLWPVAPIVAWYFLVALRDLGSWAAVRLRRPEWALDRVVVALLLVANAVWLAGAVARASASGWAADAAYQAQILDMRDVARYLSELTPPDGILGTNHLSTASWWYLYTGRRGLDAVVRADGEEPFYVRRAVQGDPGAIAYFVYHRDNPNVDAGEADLPVLAAALTARGAAAEPLYCAPRGGVCVYDWRPRPAGQVGPP